MMGRILPVIKVAHSAYNHHIYPLAPERKPAQRSCPSFPALDSLLCNPTPSPYISNLTAYPMVTKSLPTPSYLTPCIPTLLPPFPTPQVHPYRQLLRRRAPVLHPVKLPTGGLLRGVSRRQRHDRLPPAHQPFGPHPNHPRGCLRGGGQGALGGGFPAASRQDAGGGAEGQHPDDAE